MTMLIGIGPVAKVEAAMRLRTAAAEPGPASGGPPPVEASAVLGTASAAANGDAGPEHVLRRLEWKVLRRLDGRIQGDFRTLLYGSGVDVADLREYQPGDDVRHIDWNVTARMDTPYIRTYLEDRDLSAWLLLDRSASMGFGPQSRPKERVLVELSAALARLLVRGGNGVGAMLYGRSLEKVIEPRSGRSHVLRLISALMSPPAAVSVPVSPTWRERFRKDGSRGKSRDAGTREHGTDLGELFRSAHRAIRRRSLVIVISDFVAEPGWEKDLLALSQRHEVVALRLVDPTERSLPDAGFMVVQDAETGELLSIDSSDPAFRQRYEQAAIAQDGAIAAAITSARADLHIVSTEEPLVDALVRIAHRRKARRS